MNIIERPENLIERLRTLEAAATPGPWEDSAKFFRGLLFPTGPRGQMIPQPEDFDRELIAEMRNALPEIFSTIERLERENATYHGVTKALHEERMLNQELLKRLELFDTVVAAAQALGPVLDPCTYEEEALMEALAALKEKE